MFRFFVLYLSISPAYFVSLYLPKKSAEQTCNRILGGFIMKAPKRGRTLEEVCPKVRGFAISGLAHLKNLRIRDLQINHNKFTNFAIC
jgi:hypothetical protein